ncbi:MAG: hypothetical protein K6U08_05430 [Firmicutes bacterium]|nr:hypothetical protein [Bacillota bacterium]
MVPYVRMAVEGDLDEAVGRRLLALVGLECWEKPFGLKGKHGLVKSLPAYCRSARRDPWFILLDLDRDATCAPVLIEQLVGPKAPELLSLRIAVRAVESWLMADRDGFAKFLAVAPSAVPVDPDEVPVPKQTVVNLARRSRSRQVRQALVPEPESSGVAGPLYGTWLASFVSRPEDGWDPVTAATNSPSLKSCIEALRRLRRRLEHGC